MKRLNLILVLVMLMICAVPQNKTYAAAQKSGIAEQWIAGWNSHDPAKLAALFTADVMYEDVAFAEVSHGQAELRKFAADEFEAVPDLKVELTGSAIQGGHGTIEWKFSGTDKGVFKTGKPFSVRGVSVVTVVNGKISRNVDFYDAATLMKEVGVLPAPGSTDSK